MHLSNINIMNHTITLILILVGLFSIVLYTIFIDFYANFEMRSKFIFSTWKKEEFISKLQNIPECDCKRAYFYAGYTEDKRIKSSCSDEASFYEKNQKVVSMSLFLKADVNPKIVNLYKEGVKLNLEAMRKHYPGHSLRLYTNVSIKEEGFCNVYCDNSDLFWCDIRKTPSLGDESKMFFMSWRFLPLGDSTVDYFLSRDLDSVITKREEAVVRDWLESGKAIHLMRDHPDQNAPILGGLWGAKNSLLGKDISENLLNEIIKSAKQKDKKYQRKGGDQFTLNDVIFYEMGENIVAYDSYSCQFWSLFTEVRPFPIQRLNNQTDFVGNAELGRQVYNLSKCPKECRPMYGASWEYC